MVMNERHIYVFRNGERYGPFSVELARQYLNAGSLQEDDNACEAGKVDIRLLRELIAPSSRKWVASGIKESLSGPRKCVCPECGSFSVQNVRLLYEAGTTTSRVSGTTIGMAGVPGSGEIPMIGSVQTSSCYTSRSILAQRFSPPSPESTELPIRSNSEFMALLITIVLLFWGVGIWATWDDVIGGESEKYRRYFFVVAILTGPMLWILFKRAGRARREEHYRVSYLNEQRESVNNRRMDIWERSFVCHTCGYFGLLSPRSSPD